MSPDLLFSNVDAGDKWVFSINNRYFNASSSYRGDKEFSDTLVTNRLYSLDISLLRILKKGWSIGLFIPVSAKSRTNGADHMGPLSYPKYTTQAFGLGDIKFSVYKWIQDPTLHRKGNIQVGLGIKLPT